MAPAKIDLYLEYFSYSKLNNDEKQETQLKVPLSTLVTICVVKMTKVIPNTGSFILFLI